MRRAFILCTLLASAAAHAGALYGVATTVSRHFPDRGYNQVNPGLGVEYDQGPWAFALGEYRNSYRRTTTYATAGFLPVKMGRMRFGVFAGPATGYNVPAIAGAVLAWRSSQQDGWGVNVLAIPPAPKDGAAVVALQLLKAF